MKTIFVQTYSSSRMADEQSSQGEPVSPLSFVHLSTNTSSSSPSSSSWSKTVKVFLVVTGQTFGADQVILEQVENTGWSTWKVEITRNLQECDVIIVFCPIVSRVGSDVEAAMREDSVSSGGKPVILVLMHHTRDPDYSTSVRKWSETFQNVVLDVHVLFHETQPGSLLCSRNDRAVKLIQEELKKPVCKTHSVLVFNRETGSCVCSSEEKIYK
ncbi:uncharacterized protein LOC116057953 [Sander lucioperca]|uniref:uncharacterized protein LOC116057953 n=1 Tax=Sander lucioperca TaxID=283035 RepID=UPI001653E0A9|nr:uncharacterized protein LOC116057953 [Sander lucioperca]